MLDRIGLSRSEKRVLDVGAYRSEMMAALRALGFARAHGIDLNYAQPPAPGTGSHCQADMMQVPFRSHTFDHITAVSVLEHGVEPDRFFGEVARLLRPGGSLLASVDYWPDKIDTSDTPLFGLPWNIFCESELIDLICRARDFGLVVGDSVDTKAGDPLIHFAGRRYTFAVLEFTRIKSRSGLE